MGCECEQWMWWPGLDSFQTGHQEGGLRVQEAQTKTGRVVQPNPKKRCWQSSPNDELLGPSGLGNQPP